MTRNALFDARRRSSEVLEAYNVKDRIQTGYTRVSPVEIAGKAGVWMSFLSLDRLLGAFIREKEPWIIVNFDRPTGLVHMTSAHELGHYFLDHATTHDVGSITFGDKGDIKERQAEHFAYSLLAPGWLIAKIAKLKRWGRNELENPHVVYQLSLRLGISFSAAIWVLLDNKYITKPTANKLKAIQPKSLKQKLIGPDNEDWRLDVWQLDQSDKDLIIEPRANDKFVLDLPNRLSAGYVWTPDDVADAGYQLEPLLVNIEKASKHDQSNIPAGGAESARYRFYRPDSEVENYDRERWEFVEKQPWNGGGASDNKFGFSTEIVSDQGLTPETRAEWLERYSHEA